MSFSDILFLPVHKSKASQLFSKAARVCVLSALETKFRTYTARQAQSSKSDE